MRSVLIGIYYEDKQDMELNLKMLERLSKMSASEQKQLDVNSYKRVEFKNTMEDLLRGNLILLETKEDGTIVVDSHNYNIFMKEVCYKILNASDGISDSFF